MQKEELRKQIAATSTKAKVLELGEIAKREDFAVKDLLDLTFDADKQIGFHAAWVLDNLLCNHPSLILENLDELILRLPHVFNESCKRHYARIFMHTTSPKTISELKVKINSSDLKPIVETCFDWLIDPKVAVAVKAFCCETLFNLRNRYDWITEELIREIEFLMNDGSAAMQSKGKKILNQLQR